MTHNTETGVLNCLISVGMTPVLQDPKSRQDWGHLDRENEKLQTLWIGEIFTGKMTFWRDMCLTKVVHILEPGILNTPNSCQDDTLSLKNPSMGQWGIFTGKTEPTHTKYETQNTFLSGA